MIFGSIFPAKIFRKRQVNIHRIWYSNENGGAEEIAPPEAF